ncbi:hypothetical protein KC368_g6 [Hortaea werneckii]|nr:hypothetical protein KC368_g6 [Hortaea werneckii]
MNARCECESFIQRVRFQALGPELPLELPYACDSRRCFLKVQPQKTTPLKISLEIIADNTHDERRSTSSASQNLFVDTISPRTHLPLLMGKIQHSLLAIDHARHHLSFASTVIPRRSRWRVISLLLQYPDLSSFPEVEGTVHTVSLSDEVAKAYAESVLVNFGTDGCVRCSHLQPLPIIKLAHPNKVSRLRIQHEFDMLKEMRRYSLRVPIFDDNPMLDDEGLFGYRMEQLYPIDFSNTQAISDDLKTLVNQVHDSGFSHGDLNPSNVMRNSNGSLVLIDPSRGGPLGQEVPHYIPSYQYEGTVFSTTTLTKSIFGGISQLYSLSWQLQQSRCTLVWHGRRPACAQSHIRTCGRETWVTRLSIVLLRVGVLSVDLAGMQRTLREGDKLNRFEA